MGSILGPFCQNLGKNEFSWKKGLCQFVDIPIIYHCNNNQKKLLNHFCRTGGQADGHLDRRADRSDCSSFIIGQTERQKPLF